MRTTVPLLQGTLWSARFTKHLHTSTYMSVQRNNLRTPSQKESKLRKAGLSHKVTGNVRLPARPKTVHKVREAGIVEASFLDAGRVGHSFSMNPPSELGIVSIRRDRGEGCQGDCEREQE